MAARNRARTPVRIRCIKKTTPPETSCGTPEEAYKVPPSLTVAIRDQQLRLVPSRRPRPEQHSPRIPLVPRALLRALETELLDQRAPFHVLGRDVAAHLLDRRRVVRDEADGRERRSPPSRSPAPRRQFAAQQGQGYGLHHRYVRIRFSGLATPSTSASDSGEGLRPEVDIVI